MNLFNYRTFILIPLAILVMMASSNAKVKVRIKDGGSNGFSDVSYTKLGDYTKVVCKNPGQTQCPVSFAVTAEFGQDGVDLVGYAVNQIEAGSSGGSAIQNGVQIVWTATSTTDYELDLDYI